MSVCVMGFEEDGGVESLYVFTVKMVLLFYSKYQEAADNTIFTRKNYYFYSLPPGFGNKVAQSWLPSYLSLCYCDSGATFTVSTKTVNVVRGSDKAVSSLYVLTVCIAHFFL